MEGLGGDSAVFDGQVGPAQAGGLLNTEQQVEATAEGRGVQQEGAFAEVVSGGGQGDSRGKGGCAGATAGSGHRDNHPVSDGTARVGGEGRDQGFGGIGQGKYLFGADGGGGLPVEQTRFTVGHQYDTRTPRAANRSAGAGSGGIDQNQRRAEPGMATDGQRTFLEASIGGGRDAADLIAQSRLIDEQ